jgi:hypothetical protein
MTKNITLSVEDAVLEKVKIVAAQEKTTVNAMVRGFLAEQARKLEVPERRRVAVERLLELSRSSEGRIKAGWKFDRESLYAERLSRHEHSPLRSGGAEE